MSSPRARRGVPIAALLVVTALAVPACSSGGGGGGAAFVPGAGTGGTGGGGTGGGTTGGGSTTPPGPPGSPTNQAQWQTALAALAAAPSPDPVSFTAPGIAAYNDLIARSWATFNPRVAYEVELALRSSVGNALQGVSILNVGNVTFDPAAPPALGASAPSTRQTFELHLPRTPDRWNLTVEVIVGGTIPITVFGITTNVSIQIPVTVTASDVAVVAPIDMDLADPAAPRIVSSGTPTLGFALRVDSPAPVFAQVAGLVTQLLDPIVRAALTVGSILAQQQIGILLAGLPNDRAWGRGGPGVTPLASPPALEPIADALADEIDRNQMPFGNVYEALYDTPDTGGTLVGYRHHGDAAIWTGTHLAGLAYRHDLDGDPRAIAAAARIVDAFDVQTRISPPPFDGLLARTAIPASSPHAAALNPGTGRTYSGVVDGVLYHALGSVSRDQHIGTMFGLGQAHHRMPALRGEISPVVIRMIDQLERHGWTVYQAPGQPDRPPDPAAAVSTTFAQSPQGVLAFATVAKMVDPARYGALYDRSKPLADILWFNAWFSSGEVHDSYYKFNLGHTNFLSAIELTTDPDVYRAYLRLLRVMRATVGSHDNAWFDVIAAIADPSIGPGLAPKVQAALERWTLRPRRGFAITNSTDPTIQKATVSSSLPGGSLTPGTPLNTSTRTKEVAVYALPVERRTATDFLWQRSPFSLDGSKDPHEQPPGIDLITPYWAGRNHGLLR